MQLAEFPAFFFAGRSVRAVPGPAAFDCFSAGRIHPAGFWRTTFCIFRPDRQKHRLQQAGACSAVLCRSLCVCCVRKTGQSPGTAARIAALTGGRRYSPLYTGPKGSASARTPSQRVRQRPAGSTTLWGVGSGL